MLDLQALFHAYVELQNMNGYNSIDLRIIL